MATVTKVVLSGSTNGKPIKVVATGTTGTTIHTASSVTGTVGMDEVWLWAYNSDTVDRALTVEFGGTTAPDQNIVVTIPFKAGLVLVVPGLILQNSLIITAFAAAANVVTLSGFVNRIVN
jgi:hypothetical protein